LLFHKNKVTKQQWAQLTEVQAESSSPSTEKNQNQQMTRLAVAKPETAKQPVNR